jgi:beta-lactam-binding protein with PASTA domain
LGLSVGATTQEYSSTVAAGSVISQNPPAGDSVVPGSAVDLVVSKGPAPVTVPNVVGSTESAASTAIVAAGLTVGTITQEYNSTVAAGSVLSQNPAADSAVAPGSVVDLVVSKGPAPVTVPNVVGSTESAASASITGAGLSVGAITQEYSSTVTAGSVISQNPAADSTVAPGSVVDLVVSKGPAPVTVTNVVGSTESAASASITGAGLIVGAITQEYSSTVASGSVISQNPAADSTVAPGSAVDLVVSKGPAPVTVPNVVGSTESAASASLTGAGLAVGTITREYSSTVASGSVISQNPSAGGSAAPGSVVDLVVSKGPQPVTVPNVVGSTESAASTAITTAGLTVGTITREYSSTVVSGSVISQNPSAGGSATPGSVVDLVLSKGPQPVTVPNVVGSTESAASTALTGAGLAVGTITREYSSTVMSGSVISQELPSGSLVAPGTPVDLVVSRGPQPVPVPGVVGSAESAASTAITGAGLIVGTITREYSSTVAAGTVISQNPAAGSFAASGGAVDLVVSRGPQPVTVSSLVGLSRSQAESILAAQGLTVGAVTEQHSDAVAAGRVVSHDPAAGAQVAAGTAVNLVVSLGPAVTLVTVPNLVGESRAAAESALAGAGLTVGTVVELYSATVAAGAVISHAPAAGTQVASGASVNLALSLGPAPSEGEGEPGAQVAPPDLSGMTAEQAAAALSALGLTILGVAQEVSDTVPAGQIIRQEPPFGSVLPPGSSVRIIVSSGAAPRGCVLFGWQKGRLTLDGLGKMLGDLFLVGAG